MKALVILCLAYFCIGSVFAETIIHREKSLYRNILIKQEGSKLCLVFSTKKQRRNRRQTCIDVNNPQRLLFDYVRMTFAGLLIQPEPERTLMIGLGGGTISRVLADVYRGMQIDLVEVDPAVVKVARDYFGFHATDNTPVHVMDGRVFVRRAALRGEKYDLVILDAFDGDYIPEHLMTVEFLTDIRALLSENGVVIANTFTGSALYHHESVTYAAVFGPFINFKMPGASNRIILASQGRLPDNETLADNARMLAGQFAPYDIDLVKYLPYLDREADWKTNKRPLTDQYAPANLLRERQ